jgi:hypothetical protein
LAKVKREKKEDRKETVPANRANDYRPMTAAALALSDESRGRRLMILTYLESTGKATIGAIGRAVGLDIPQVQNLLNQMIEDRHIKGENNGTYSHPNYKQKQTVKSS